MHHLTSEEARPIIPVSVVIPAFNAEQFIGRTLKMLEFQTVRPAEIIVVDDGSTDNTASIAEKTSVRVIRVQHVGSSAAMRNVGIAAASNEWIALLDVDDIWDPEKLESQWELRLANSDLNFIATDYDEIDRVGSVLIEDSVLSLRQYRRIASRQLSRTTSLLTSDILARSLPEWGLFLPSTVMFSRQLVLTVGGFDTGVEAEDTEFFLRCIARGNAAMVERPLVAYVRHPSQKSALWSKPGVALGVCERVLSHPEKYHPESVAIFQKLLPRLLLRQAYSEICRGKIGSGIAATVRATRFACFPAIALTLFLRLAARHTLARRCLAILPAARESLELIPGRDSTHLARALIPQWYSIIAAAAG